MTETSPFIEVNGHQLDVRREDIASAIVKAMGVTLSHDRCFKLDKAFLGEERLTTTYLLKPLPIGNSNGVRYFYQINPLGYPTWRNVQLFRLAPGEAMPSVVEFTFKKPEDALPSWLPTLRKSRDEWPHKKTHVAEIEKQLHEEIEKIGIENPFTENVYIKKPVFLYARPFDTKSDDDESYQIACLRAVKEKLDLQSLALLAKPYDDAALDDLTAHLDTAYRLRAELRETETAHHYIGALNPDTVKALKTCNSFDHANYFWVHFGALAPQSNDDARTFNNRKRHQPSSEKEILYRQQFLTSMPFFARLALLDRNTPLANIAAAKLDKLIQSGQEILKVNPDGTPGPGLQFFAELLQMHAHNLGTDMPEIKPYLLQALCKLRPHELPEEKNFFKALPWMAKLPPEHLPKTPAGWQTAFALLQGGVSFMGQTILQTVAPNWDKAACHFAARLARAHAGDPGVPPSLSSAWADTKDYADRLFQTLILPAAIASGASPAGIWPMIALSVEQQHKLYQRFMEHFSVNGLLETSLHYHRPHVRDAYRAALWPLESEQAAAWPALTENFVIPQGTYFDGTHLGGMRITWLTTEAQLIEESEANRHCVDGYASKCLTEGSHVIRIQSPGHSGKRSTLELIEQQGHTGYQVVIGQHRGYRNAQMAEGSVNAKAAKWLVQAINDGQKSRKAPTKVSRPTVEEIGSLAAPIHPSTGRPDFKAIDFPAIIKARQAAEEKSRPSRSGVFLKALTYDPRQEGAVETMLAAAKAQKLLPRSLRNAQNAQELLEAMGIEMIGGMVIVKEESRQSPRRPRPIKDQAPPAP